ncbi:class I SAM-dependent methyltransferase [soil metagenome]
MDKTKIAVEIFNKLAHSYQEKFMDVSLYHDSFDLFCESIEKENADVLELACGPGNITKYILEKRPDLKILGTDLAPKMLELAKKNNRNASFQLMDCREIISLNKKFDAVMCGFALPYLSKEEAVKLIADAALILNAGGVVYISTMEDDYNKSGFEKGSTGEEIFMHYHEAGYLTNALENNGFEILKLMREEFVKQDGTGTDLLILSRLK